MCKFTVDYFFSLFVPGPVKGSLLPVRILKPIPETKFQVGADQIAVKEGVILAELPTNFTPDFDLMTLRVFGTLHGRDDVYSNEIL
ncbi:hypothetical protein K435DRAFT_879734 [Dendrothele bispora CBS 962.96]|uniref:Uncharacterized protein n=1 Tax=Dendrothele bispora (strain CBS 962.96) TaxID=1314807 RepID=A0A4S8KKT4_DENBC|nr:hypothetical protein K435DRAFT_879734 [Dendrothele bispora CBS 962.96]